MTAGKQIMETSGARHVWLETLLSDAAKIWPLFIIFGIFTLVAVFAPVLGALADAFGIGIALAIGIIWALLSH